MPASPREPILIVGAGPIGLSCAIAARRRGLHPLVIDAGAIAESIVRYPVGMTFFTTPERLEIGGHPLVCSGAKATREEALRTAGVSCGPGAAAGADGCETAESEPVIGGHRVHPRRPPGRGDDAGGAGGARHRLLRPPQPPRRSRRAAAPRVALLRRGPPVRGSRGRRHRRQELGGGDGPAAVPGRRQGHARVPGRLPAGERQVLAQARSREPHQGRRDRGALRRERGRDHQPRGGAWRRGPDRGGSRVHHPGITRTSKLFSQIGIAFDSATGRPTLNPETLEASVPRVYLAGSVTAGRKIS